jgi:hypothetical protein
MMSDLASFALAISGAVAISSAPATSFSNASTSDEAQSFVLYRYRGRRLVDSKWGKIAELQRAMERALAACGAKGIGGADGVFGRVTREGLDRLLSCPGYGDLAYPPADPLAGTVHVALWRRLVPDGALPSVHQRAFAVSLTHEATDYDRVEWNYGTRDDQSALTWGPYGATVGHGNEVRGILRRLRSVHPDLLTSLFQEETPTLTRLLDEPAASGYALLKSVHADERRRSHWQDALQRLGTTAEGRDAYEWYAFRSDEWLTPNLRRLYGTIPAGVQATEIDYAFFLDLAMHSSITPGRVAAAKAAIVAEQNDLGRPPLPGERRRIVARIWNAAVSPAWRWDRVGRSVVYYVDAIGADRLSEEESAAWRQRTGRSAGDFGLSDARTHRPDLLD